MNLPWDFKKVCWVIFRGQKYVKKGYMEMRKWIFLVPLKSALGRSILHYWVLFLFSFEVFALLGLLSLTTFWVSVDKILLASSTLLEFSDNNSKLFEVEIGLVNDVLIFDANFLGIMKGSVWIFVFLSKLPVFTVFWITFWFSSKVWMMQFLVLHSSRRQVISSWSLFNSDCDEPTEVSFAVFLSLIVAQ